jgi:predicted transcriptional regulator
VKAVLISIQPKWCSLIASGEKTVEVRKTEPKIALPFKCYIYETQGKTDEPWMDEDGHMIFRGRGMVIGEFECKDILKFTLDPYGHHEYFISDDDLEASCLTYEELWNYGKGKTLYGWHISDLVIYDKPKELWEFHKPCEDIKNCLNKNFREAGRCLDKCFDCGNELTRPPQSWCYVERSDNNGE